MSRVSKYRLVPLPINGTIRRNRFIDFICLYLSKTNE